jgi:hypothetical protein
MGNRMEFRRMAVPGKPWIDAGNEIVTRLFLPPEAGVRWK